MNLNEIAQLLRNSNKKVQLIYAFNGVGKTRLSKEFKSIVEPKDEYSDGEVVKNKRILYYNAFTEDLFYWDNDLENGTSPKLRIHPNAFTKWIFEDQGQDQNVISFFQHYTSDKLNPKFNAKYISENKDGKEILVDAFTEVTFSYGKGDDENSGDIKVSKGEESCFIWSVFYALFDQVVNVLNVADESDRESDQFDNLEFVFIDDPVTSLDDNHLIQMAIDLADVIKKSDQGNGLKFIITTHSPVFYNVLFNEINKKKCYMLEKCEDGTYELEVKDGDSNTSFSYHLHLKNTLEEAISSGHIQKYHFMLLRNMYEKTASFLGFPRWKELLPENKETYYSRIIQFASHSTISNEVVADPTPQEKQTLKYLHEHLINNYNFWKEAKKDV